MAKCNLGKVKIEPMLVRVVFYGVGGQPHSACDMMRGGPKGLAPSPRRRGSLLVCLRIVWFCWSLRITSRGFYEPLQISCCSCCESLRILADRSGSFRICFSKSLRIHADLRRSICRGAAIWVRTLPSPSDVSNLVGKYGGSGEYFSTDIVQCDGASWQLLAGVVPPTGLPWISPCLGLKYSGPLPTFKVPVPKLIYWRRV